MTGTRKAHFLSKFYLGGFTMSGRKDDRFWVFSKAQERRWSMKAEAAGHQRDLFRLEGPESRADDLENGFGSVENRIAPVLREVIKTKRLPRDARDFSILLHLPSLNAARPPSEIDAISDEMDQAMRSWIADALTPDFHQRILADWAAEGRDVDVIADLNEVKRRIEGGSIRVRFDKNHLLTMVAARAAGLVEMNHARSWSLLETTESNGFFICSDRPVYLLNNQNLIDVQARFNDHRYDVIMPLAKELCMVGHTHGSDGAGDAHRETVRFINHMTESRAADYVYSPNKEYDAATISDLGVHTTEHYRADLLRTQQRRH